jgi:GT2 family glycosyltransferase
MTGHIAAVNSSPSDPSKSKRVIDAIESVSNFMTKFSGKDYSRLFASMNPEIIGFSGYLRDFINEMKAKNFEKTVINGIAVTKIIAALSLWMGFSESSHFQLNTHAKEKELSYEVGQLYSQRRSGSISVVIPLKIRGGDQKKFDPMRKLISILLKSAEIKKVFLIGDINNEYSEKLREKGVQIIVPEVDFGPAYARNIGIESSLEEGVDSVIFLDDDVILNDAKDLTKIAKISRRTKSIISPLVLSYENTIFDNFHNYDGTLNGTYISAKQDGELLYATTCAMAVPIEVLESGLRFDTTFSLAAGEDIDFSFKSRSMGYGVFPLNSVSVVHDYGYPLNFDSIAKFISRFERYGAGNRRVLSIYPDYYEKVSFSSPRRSVSTLNGVMYIPTKLRALIRETEMNLT